MATLALVALATTFASSAAVGTVMASVALAAASIVGGYIDGKLFGAKPPDETGSPKLDTIKVTSSTEGMPIPRVYGTFRTGAEVIWATEYEEVPAGGSSGGKGGGSAGQDTQTYKYYGNFALAFCEGKIDAVNKMWIDGKETKLTDYTHRIYLGDETQLPDSLIELKEGLGNAPAYRGIAYIVFERIPLEKYGNRIPQFNFEIVRKPSAFWATAPATGTDSIALERVIRTVMADYDFTEFELNLPGEVDGYEIRQTSSLRDALQPLLAVGMADVIESGEVIKFVPRSRNVEPIVLDQLDLLDPTGPGDAQTSSQLDSDAYQPLITVSRAQETDLPLYHVMKYLERENEYSVSTVSSARRLVRTVRKVESNSPAVMSRAHAQLVSDSILAQAWIERESAEFALMPSMLRFEPADLITVADYMNTGRLLTLKAMTIEEGYSRRVSAVKSLWQPTNNLVVNTVRPITPSQVAPDFGQSSIFVVKSPLLVDEDVDGQSYVAANQSPWPAGVSIQSSPTTSGYTLRKAVTARGSVGKVIAGTSWGSGVTGIWDTANTLVVQMQNGQLASSTEAAVLSGANSALVQNSTGSWEVIQFVSAELIAAKTYKLTKFLRAQRGSDYALNLSVPINSQFVFFDYALQDFPFTAAEIGLTFNLSYGPSTYPLGHPTYQNTTYEVTKETVRCYSPTNVRLDRVGSSYVISWKRRTRRGGDSWEISDAPLSENFEQYTVVIRNSLGAIVRTATVTEQRYIYTITNYISDFGTSDIAPLDVEVWQSNDYGAGHPKRQSLPLSSVAA